MSSNTWNRGMSGVLSVMLTIAQFSTLGQARIGQVINLTNSMWNWTGPLACLSLFSIMSWIRVRALFRKLPFYQSCYAIKRGVIKFVYSSSLIFKMNFVLLLYLNIFFYLCIEWSRLAKFGFQMVGTRTEQLWTIWIPTLFGIRAPTVLLGIFL